MFRAGIGVLFVLAATAAPADAADAVADFYKGKQLKMIVGNPPGGGYDLYARLLIRHLSKHIPGNPTFVVQNMDGASGRIANAWLFNQAPRDGTVIGAVGQATPTDQAMGQEGIQYETAKFNWIGNPIVDNNVTSLWSSLGITTVDELKAKSKGVVCGGSGATSSSVTFPQALNNLLGLDMKIISGYPGGNQMNLALEQGEINCRGGGSWAATKATSVDFMKAKKLNMIVQWGPEKLAEVSEYQGRDVPLILDLAQNADDRIALQFLISDVTMGRPILAPPDVPADRVTGLRRAFDETMKDPAFLVEAEKQSLNINAMTGEKLQAFATVAAATPKAVVERTRQLINPKDVSQYKR